jgi:carbamoyl-phosphate synthase large subunit
MTLEKIHKMTAIDRWFLHNLSEIIELERTLLAHKAKDVPAALLRTAKEYGFSDRQLAGMWGVQEEDVAALRRSHGIVPDFKLVDTCAAEFKAFTPYYYSSYDC